MHDHERTDDLQMLAAVLATPELRADAIDRGRNRLYHVLRGPVPKRRTGRLATGIGLSATAAAVVAAAVVTSVSTAPTASASARQLLLADAISAAQKPQSTGTYWYVATTPVGSHTRTETWTRRDGDTWLRGRKTHGEVLALGQPASLRLGGPAVSFAQLQSLPSDPAALKAWIANTLEKSDVTTSAGRPDAKMQQRLVFDGLLSLVSQLPAPPRVRAGAFRALASYPQVRSLGAVTRGQRLLISLPGGRQAKLVIDSASSQVRETNFFVSTDGAEVWLRSPATVTAKWTSQRPR